VPSITARPNQSPSEPCRSLLPSRVDGRQVATSPSTSFRPAYAPPPTVGRQEFMGAVEYSRSGCPDLGVHTSRFKLLSYLLGPWAVDGSFVIYKGIQGGFEELWISGAGSAEEPGLLQRHGQGCVEGLLGLEDPKLSPSVLTGVHLLYLRNSWKVYSRKFAN
jgi:hypothetical protein